MRGGLLFAYGVTNSGKTHSIIGPKEEPGIFPTLVARLLAVQKQIRDNGYSTGLGLPVLSHFSERGFQLQDISVNLQVFEVYNEQIFDILAKNKTKLVLKEDEHHHCLVRGLQEIELNSTSLEAVLQKCLTRRAIGDNSLNSQSSRSHLVLKVKVGFWYSKGLEGVEEERSICIVDLAGSQKSKNSRIDESSSINKSLLCLGRCLQAFREQKNAPQVQVPFRQSKLTRVIYEYFLENNLLIMLVCVNPQRACYQETLKVLEYAALAKEIKQSRTPIHRRLCPPSKSPIKVFLLQDSKNLTPTKNNQELNPVQQKLGKLQDGLTRLKREELLREAYIRGTAVNQAFELIFQYNERAMREENERVLGDLISMLNAAKLKQPLACLVEPTMAKQVEVMLGRQNIGCSPIKVFCQEEADQLITLDAGTNTLMLETTDQAAQALFSGVKPKMIMVAQSASKEKSPLAKLVSKFTSPFKKWFGEQPSEEGQLRACRQIQTSPVLQPPPLKRTLQFLEAFAQRVLGEKSKTQQVAVCTQLSKEQEESLETKEDSLQASRGEQKKAGKPQKRKRRTEVDDLRLSPIKLRSRRVG